MSLADTLNSNIQRLKDNAYPGRGIVLGLTEDAENLVQVYWIMGRSENSRNRIFENEGDFVRTTPFDQSKLIDPSLIIYYPVKSEASYHVLSNGDHTDIILDYLKNGKSFEAAVSNTYFEPDHPNYTPRISGIINLKDKKSSYKLAIVKSVYNDPQYCERQFFIYEKCIPGVGHCIHTYEGDGSPLPSFKGEPFITPLFNNIEEIAEFYWDNLNSINKVSLMVKFITAETLDTKIHIINKNG